MLRLKGWGPRKGSEDTMGDPIVERLDIEKTTAPMILIIGQTGAGKSHFCNKVVGEDAEVVEESDSLKSCTLGGPPTFLLLPLEHC